MSKKALAVIGANYGDEAKGAMVDRLAEGPETLVVRFNGGDQAGHTVTTPERRRHIFHHVGSGAFKGARTFLSRFFVANPMSLIPELTELATQGAHPKIHVDRRALLTTPYDMLINQVVEISRGHARHGSCGHGFGETIERFEKGSGTTVGDIENVVDLKRKLIEIRDVWTPARLAEMGVETVPSEYRRFFTGDAMIDAYIDHASDFGEYVAIGSDEVLRQASHIVFEGAQGLLLDQDRGAFPHVTRSNTGLKNVLALAKESDLDAIDVVYASRSYLTRHGSGPLPGELAEPPFPGIVDETNHVNLWQGALRFAHLDVDALVERLSIDLGDAAGSGVRIHPSLAMTCLDQAPERTPIVMDGKLTEIPRREILPRVLERLNWVTGFEGWGAERDAWKRMGDFKTS